MARIMLRVDFLTIRMGGIFNSIFQQLNISNLKMLPNDEYVKAVTRRGISTNKVLLKKELKPHERFVDKQGNVVKKKGKESPKIAVINLDGSKTSMYLKEAEKIAKSQRLDLIELGVVADKKIYKFSDSNECGPEFASEETKDNRIKKIMMTSSISGNDLVTKINTINKLLQKKNEVLVEIIKKNTEASTNEMIAKKIRDEISSDYRIVTSSSKTKFRLYISLNQSHEQESQIKE